MKEGKGSSGFCVSAEADAPHLLAVARWLATGADCACAESTRAPRPPVRNPCDDGYNDDYTSCGARNVVMVATAYLKKRLSSAAIS